MRTSLKLAGLGWALACVACGGTAPADAVPRDAGAPDVDAESDASSAGRIDTVIAALRSQTIPPAELEALLHDVAWREGWPLREAGRVLFVTEAGGAALSVVSDVNGWSPTASPALRSASGRHAYVVLSARDFAVDPAGAKYKWWSPPATFASPSEATAYGRDENGLFGFVAPPRDRRFTERFPALSSVHLSGVRAVRASIPARFVSGMPARTLLLHDGQNVLDADGPDAPLGGWGVDTRLAGAFADVLLVAVDNAPDRFEAYTHVADTVSGVGTRGGRAADYEALLDQDVLPFVRARYRVTARGASLMVMGSSLGGLVSLHMAYADPARQRCVAAMSPTAGWGAFGADGSMALARLWRAHGSAAIYLDSGGGPPSGAPCADGDGDGVDEDAEDTDNYCATSQLRDVLARRGYTFDVDLFHWHEPGAPHAEPAWSTRVPRALAACATAGWLADSPG